MLKYQKSWRTIGLWSVSFPEAAAIGAILIMLHLMISFFLKNDLLLRTTLSDILIPIVDGLATISLFSLASNPELEPRIRKAWTFMAIGLLSNTLADTSWTILEIGLHQEIYPSIADVFYLAFYPFFALGIFLLPAAPLSSSEKSKTVLDMAIISITAVLLYWLFLIGPLMEAGGESSLALIISVAYPIMDLLLAFALVFLIYRKLSTKDDRRAIHLLTFGIMIFVVADAFYAVQTQLETYATGNLVDTALLTGIVFFGLAGRSQMAWRPGTTTYSPKLDFLTGKIEWHGYLPYLAVGVNYALLTWSYLYRPAILFPVICGLGGNVALVLIRQYIVLKENLKLYSTAQNEIADRKLSERALRDSEERYRAIVEDQTELILRFKPDGTFTFVNEATSRYFGKEFAELVGDSFWPLILEEDRKAVELQFASLGPQKPVAVHEQRVLDLNGEIRWQQWTTRAIFRDGKAFELQSIGQDITVRKQAEEDLRRKDQLMAGLAKAMNLIIVEKDTDLGIQGAISIIAKAVGVDRVYIFENHFRGDEAVMSQRYEWVRDNIEPQMDALQNVPYSSMDPERYRALAEGRSIKGMVRNLRDHERAVLDPQGILSIMLVPISIDGRFWGFMGFDECRTERLWSDLEDSVLQVAAGSIGGALAKKQAENELIKARDELEVRVLERTAELEGANVYLRNEIAERKQAEQALSGTLEELQRSNKDLEQFAYVTSHDLQEPLRMIAGFMQLLSRRYTGKLDSDADEYISFAVTGASRMQNMISDLLAYSRVGTKGKPFEPTNSETILKQARDNLRVAIEENGAIITSDPLPMVMADSSQLLQLLQNLIGNAIKFRSKDIVPRVHISAERKGAEQLFSISDNGIGIPADYYERIFVIFQRLHGRDEYPGTGIGLAICKKIV
jgi:PAS domain S-box-containing protein